MASSIDRTVPVSHSALTSAAVRANFGAAANDIEALQGLLIGFGVNGNITYNGTQRVSFGSIHPDINLPGGFAPSQLTVTVDNSVNTHLSLFGYGTGQPHGFEMYFARGTEAAPTAIHKGDALIDMGGRGHDGTGFQSSSVAIISAANENWNNTSHGTVVQIQATPNGSTNRTGFFDFLGAGHFSAKAFIGAGMTSLDGFYNQVPVTYFHALGLSQGTYGHAALQDSFHAAGASQVFLSFFDDTADGTGTGRLGWFGFNADSTLNVINSMSGGKLRFSAGSDVEIDTGGNLIISTLPTSNPGGSHKVWNNAGVLNIT